jgi:hypothetical protein
MTTEHPTSLRKPSSEDILELPPSCKFFYGDEQVKVHPANQLMTRGSLVAFNRKSANSLCPITLNAHDSKNDPLVQMAVSDLP